MSVVVILVLLETVRFLIKDKSETLSSKYVCRTKPTPQNYKIFCSGQHSRGYCPANFQKQPVINTIAEKRVFLCTETDVSNALYEQENPENHLPGAGLPADGAVDRTDRYGLSGTRRRGGIGGFGPGGYLLPDDLHAGIRVQHRRPDSHRPPQRSQGVFADRPSVHAKYGVPAVDGPRAVHPLESLRSPHHGSPDRSSRCTGSRRPVPRLPGLRFLLRLRRVDVPGILCRHDPHAHPDDQLDRHGTPMSY